MKPVSYTHLVDGSADAARLMIAAPFAEESPVVDGLCVETRTYDQAGNELLPSHVNCEPCVALHGQDMKACPWSGPQENPGSTPQCSSVVLEPLPPLDPQVPPRGPESTTDDGADETTDDDDGDDLSLIHI